MFRGTNWYQEGSCTVCLIPGGSCLEIANLPISKQDAGVRISYSAVSSISVGAVVQDSCTIESSSSQSHTKLAMFTPTLVVRPGRANRVVLGRYLRSFAEEPRGVLTGLLSPRQNPSTAQSCSGVELVRGVRLGQVIVGAVAVAGLRSDSINRISIKEQRIYTACDSMCCVERRLDERAEYFIDCRSRTKHCSHN